MSTDMRSSQLMVWQQLEKHNSKALPYHQLPWTISVTENTQRLWALSQQFFFTDRRSASSVGHELRTTHYPPTPMQLLDKYISTCPHGATVLQHKYTHHSSLFSDLHQACVYAKLYHKAYSQDAEPHSHQEPMQWSMNVNDRHNVYIYHIKIKPRAVDVHKKQAAMVDFSVQWQGQNK